MYLIGRGQPLTCRAMLPQASNGVAMIPPQAMHYVGLAVAKVAGYAVGRLTVAGIQYADAEILRLSKLNGPALLREIARADTPDVAAFDKLDDSTKTQQGDATVRRWLPKARALICPHRSTILAIVDSPEVKVISTVAAYLTTGGMAIPLANSLGTWLVKRGITALCPISR